MVLKCDGGWWCKRDGGGGLIVLIQPQTLIFVGDEKKMVVFYYRSSYLNLEPNYHEFPYDHNHLHVMSALWYELKKNGF